MPRYASKGFDERFRNKSKGTLTVEDAGAFGATVPAAVGGFGTVLCGFCAIARATALNNNDTQHSDAVVRAMEVNSRFVLEACVDGRLFCLRNRITIALPLPRPVQFRLCPSRAIHLVTR